MFPGAELLLGGLQAALQDNMTRQQLGHMLDPSLSRLVDALLLLGQRVFGDLEFAQGSCRLSFSSELLYTINQGLRERWPDQH